MIKTYDIFPDRFYTPMVSHEEYINYLNPYEGRLLYDVVNDMGDRLEYRGSFMFDEYPDREYLYLILQMLHDEVDKKIDSMDDAYSASNVTSLNSVHEDNDRLHMLADVMFINSMYNRRMRYFEHEMNMANNPAWNGYY